ncbi:hypothetical protein [Williamsia sp. 1135]|uniref:hypothetical protein n=1 Tax=Williamsia sp. 1135 TaxID=1889262 RepID=UPI000A113CA7|nr:hypothetical protein [Williamsia sp. 1135]ORM38175.1 hypothetical protein BFL43_00915 [Williamsia sp. 1135]
MTDRYDNDDLFSATPDPDAAVHALRLRSGTAVLLLHYLNADDDGIDVAIGMLREAGATWATITRTLLDLTTTYAPELYERGERIEREIVSLADSLGDHDGWT